MQEGQGEDADETFGGMRHDAPLPEAYTIRHLNDLHQPHHRHDDERDDEATHEFPSFCFVVHADGFIKNHSAAKVGNFGRWKQKNAPVRERFSLNHLAAYGRNGILTTMALMSLLRILM